MAGHNERITHNNIYTDFVGFSRVCGQALRYIIYSLRYIIYSLRYIILYSLRYMLQVIKATSGAQAAYLSLQAQLRL